MRFETLASGRITVATEFLPLLRARGLDSFERVMAVTEGKVMRDFPGRRTVRLEVASSVVYLKRYLSGYLTPAARLLRLVRWPGAEDEALREWQMLQALRACGVPTATPVAVGQDKTGGQVVRSFLMTAEITGGIEGDKFIRTLAAAPRRRLLRRVAEMARGLHAAGFVHKDYYLCHVLMVPAKSDPELFLIDLQRVVLPCCLRERWRVKDLAALAYSALKSGATRSDLLAAFRAYCSMARLTDADRALAHKVLRRVAWLRTRTPRHDTTFVQLD